AATGARLLDEIRNDGEATSSRQRMEFVFAGVPRLYGFTDVAPSGKRVAPFLETYLDRVGDYAAHLRRLRAASVAKPIPPNEILARALESTCFTQSSGAEPTSYAYAREEQTCYLRDERRPLAERAAQVERLAEAPGFASYLPAVDGMLRGDGARTFDEPALASLQRLREHPHARDAVLALLQSLETPVLRLGIVRAARSLGWLSAEQALPMQREIVLRLLRPPVWGEGRDFICGMGGDVLGKLDVRAEEISPEVYRDEFGIQALACLQPADPRIRDQLALSLGDSREWIARLTAAALTKVDTVVRKGKRLAELRTGPALR
ncbi:MAG: hypothetical protein ACREQJ_15725, partial [Candidatus Binatia bacterium]